MHLNLHTQKQDSINATIFHKSYKRCYLSFFHPRINTNRVKMLLIFLVCFSISPPLVKPLPIVQLHKVCCRRAFESHMQSFFFPETDLVNLSFLVFYFTKALLSNSDCHNRDCSACWLFDLRSTTTLILNVAGSF